MAKFIEILELVPEETKGDKGNKYEKNIYIPVEHICMIKRDNKTKIVSIYLIDRSIVKTKEDVGELLGRIKHAGKGV